MKTNDIASKPLKEKCEMENPVHETVDQWISDSDDNEIQKH